MTEKDMIAITAIATRCAGADNVEEYWGLLQAAEPQFSPAPADRWHPRRTDRRPAQNNRLYSDAMAPIRDPYRFDAPRYHIPQGRARRMDPQQRLAIGLAQQLRGDHSDPAVDARTATIIGVSSTDYRSLSTAGILTEFLADGTIGSPSAEEATILRTVAQRALDPVTGHTMPGVLSNMVAAAVNSTFNLGGPAFSVDASCASSLVAVDIARSLLLTGSVDACIAGGVFVALTPEAHIGFSAIGALSPSGSCRPFCAEADGLVIGEGGALLLLRRLEDARAAGEEILAILDPLGSSNDGAAPGVMTPTVAGQCAAIGHSLRQRGQESLTVDAIEAHGTATTVGDQTELNALREVTSSALEGSILLGSVKALIGHTMAAAGALSLCKAVLSLVHGVWPAAPLLPESRPHPRLEGSALRIPAGVNTVRDLQRVAVNAFGFGGTNYHAVLRRAESGARHE